jgi:hypothetical protein
MPVSGPSISIANLLFLRGWSFSFRETAAGIKGWLIWPKPCHPFDTFVKDVRNGEIVMHPKVGHGFSVQRHWMPRFKQAFTRLAAKKRDRDGSQEGGVLKDLPLIEVPTKKPGPDILAVIISGDGAWAGIDRDLAHSLSNREVSVVGLDSLKYFWTPGTPDGAAMDLERILEHYLSSWNRRQAILIGYSLGADVLPLMVNRLPRALGDRIRLIALLSGRNTILSPSHFRRTSVRKFSC